MLETNQTKTITKRTFWTVTVFYLLIGFEFLYMASPFAVYLYSIYGPGLNFINANPALSWLSGLFLPHIVEATANPLPGLLINTGFILFVLGLLAFCIGAAQVYYYKLAKRGAVTGGIYKIVRHPQYTALMISGLGLLLLWSRYIVIFIYTAMLFAYYFLAKTEERECAEKFGRSYLDYRNKTNMFLPFKLPFTLKLPVPKNTFVKLLRVIILYAAIVSAGILTANVLRQISLDSLYAVYTKRAAYISLTKIDDETLRKVIEIAEGNNEVRTKLAGEYQSKLIVYLLPFEWYVSEIQMNKPATAGQDCHNNPRIYNRDLYRIVVTKVNNPAIRQAEGKEILLNSPIRIPLLEAVVNISQNKVIDLLGPPAIIKYRGIPVPAY